MPSRKLGLVSLSDVVKMRAGVGPSTINRFNRERQVTFMANAAPGRERGRRSATASKQAIDDEQLPPEFTVRPSGQTEAHGRDRRRASCSGSLASMVFMYLILAAQFESWLHPVTILLSLPLTLPFAIASVVLFGARRSTSTRSSASSCSSAW